MSGKFFRSMVVSSYTGWLHLYQLLHYSFHSCCFRFFLMKLNSSCCYIALYIYYFDRFFRYIDEIQCAAARVVTALRKRVADSRTTIESNNNINDFDTIHIRRGDFQFKETRVDADKIVQQLNRVLNNTNTLYIATDERKKSFFKPIVDQYANVFFLDDFQQELEGVNSKFLLLLKIKYSVFQNFTLLCF